MTLDKGNGAVELTSDLGVCDGMWHHVTVTMSPAVIDITVDGHSNSLRLAHSGSRYFDLSDTVRAFRPRNAWTIFCGKEYDLASLPEEIKVKSQRKAVRKVQINPIFC